VVAPASGRRFFRRAYIPKTAGKMPAPQNPGYRTVQKL
jgi:hypothetical protein